MTKVAFISYLLAKNEKVIINGRRKLSLSQNKAVVRSQRYYLVAALASATI